MGKVSLYPPCATTHTLYVELPRLGNTKFPSTSVVVVARTWPFHHSSRPHPARPISPANGSRTPLPSRSSNTIPLASCGPTGGLEGGGGRVGGGGTGAGGVTGTPSQFFFSRPGGTGRPSARARATSAAWSALHEDSSAASAFARVFGFEFPRP